MEQGDHVEQDPLRFASKSAGVRLAYRAQRIDARSALQGACLKPGAMAKADKETAVKQQLRTLLRTLVRAAIHFPRASL